MNYFSRARSNTLIWSLRFHHHLLSRNCKSNAISLLCNHFHLIILHINIITLHSPFSNPFSFNIISHWIAIIILPRNQGSLGKRNINDSLCKNRSILTIPWLDDTNWLVIVVKITYSSRNVLIISFVEEEMKMVSQAVYTWRRNKLSTKKTRWPLCEAVR